MAKYKSTKRYSSKGEKPYREAYAGEDYRSRYTQKKKKSSGKASVQCQVVKLCRASSFTLPREIEISISSAPFNYSYFRVPVTQAIPVQTVQRPASADLDDLWRQSVYVKGVSVRFSLRYAVNFGISGEYYAAGFQKEGIELCGEPPSSFAVGKEEGNSSRLLMLEETRFLESKNSPFHVFAGPSGDPILDSPDQSLYNCRLAKGDGGPVGKAHWRVEKGGQHRTGRSFYAEFNVTSLMRTNNWGAEGGHVQYDTRSVEAYFEIEREMEFVHKESGMPVFKDPLELIFEVKAMKTLAKEISPVPCGHVSGILVDIYYR